MQILTVLLKADILQTMNLSFDFQEQTQVH